MSKTVSEKARGIAFEHWKAGIDDENLALKSVKIWQKNQTRFLVVYRMHLDSLNAFNPVIQKIKELVASQSF